MYYLYYGLPLMVTLGIAIRYGHVTPPIFYTFILIYILVFIFLNQLFKKRSNEVSNDKRNDNNQNEQRTVSSNDP